MTSKPTNASIRLYNPKLDAPAEPSFYGFEESCIDRSLILDDNTCSERGESNRLLARNLKKISCFGFQFGLARLEIDTKAGGMSGPQAWRRRSSLSRSAASASYCS